MGQFKPMVKMFTDEPSVILKLKKGGKVKAAGQEEGFKSMTDAAGNPFDAAESGKAPKKPSMAERRKAMNPNFYKKGGKVAHKLDGGVLNAPVTAPAVAASPAASRVGVGSNMIRPMDRSALMAMAPSARSARAAAVRRALTGMKKGGSADSAKIAKLEKELHHHEALSASKAHGKASGGAIDKAETRTTIEKGADKFAKTKMDTSKRDTAHGTGEVKEGKPGGYKMGGTIEGNEKKFANTKMDDGDKVDKAHGTGGVRMDNAGGYCAGGKAVRKASGGLIDKKMTKTTIEHDGDWENRPADSAKPGVKNTKTGEVKEANAGGYKHGGQAKKRYATGGNVVDDGKAVKYPRHFKSQPVANSLQSGTFKRGGKVHKATGGSSRDADPYEVSRKASQGVEEALNPLGIVKELYGKARDYFTKPKETPEGSVTKTEKSVTVTPGKRRGGLMK